MDSSSLQSTGIHGATHVHAGGGEHREFTRNVTVIRVDIVHHSYQLRVRGRTRVGDELIQICTFQRDLPRKADWNWGQVFYYG